MSKVKKIVRKQPARKVKRKRESMEEPTTEFDMVGILLSNYGMTGQNLVREIFSNMDFWKIQKIRLVCKSWNIFISDDRILIMKIVRQAEPYLEDFCCKLSDNSSSYSGSEYDCCADCGPRSETDLDHGGLYRWRENSFPFFLYQKLKKILIRYSRIILTASKVRLISKI